MKTSSIAAALSAFSLFACEKSAPATSGTPAPIVRLATSAVPVSACLSRARRGHRDPNAVGYIDISAGLNITPAQTPEPAICATWTITAYQLVPAGWQAQDLVPPFSFTTDQGDQCGTDEIIGCYADWPSVSLNGATANVGYVATASDFNDCNGNPVEATPLEMVVTATANCLPGLDVPVAFELPVSLP